MIVPSSDGYADGNLTVSRDEGTYDGRLLCCGDEVEVVPSSDGYADGNMVVTKGVGA